MKITYESTWYMVNTIWLFDNIIVAAAAAAKWL